MIWRSSMEARRWRSPPPSKALPFFIPMAATRCGCQLDARVQSLITAGDCPLRVGSGHPMTAGGRARPKTAARRTRRTTAVLSTAVTHSECSRSRYSSRLCWCTDCGGGPLRNSDQWCRPGPAVTSDWCAVSTRPYRVWRVRSRTGCPRLDRDRARGQHSAWESRWSPLSAATSDNPSSASVTRRGTYPWATCAGKGGCGLSAGSCGFRAIRDGGPGSSE